MSADLAAVHLALRNRALAVSVATTGATTLSATATGYARAAGSFVTDGFKVGMEITPTGFTSNPVDVLDAVAALALTTKSARSVEAAAGGRTIAALFPALRSFENAALTPVTGRHFIEEDFVPATHRLLSGPANGGEVVEEGEYFLKWYGIPGSGISALRKSVDALKARFTPGTNLTAGSHTVRVRGEVGPQTGQIIPLTNHAVLVLRIPWQVYSLNVIAA